VAGPNLGWVAGPWREDRDLRAAAEALVADPAQRAGVSETIMLVCAHGVHDACCAIRGRPVAAALAAEWPGQVWECSHVGGDRFAPNVVLLPDGFYYGNLDPESAVRAVRQHLAGAVEAGPLRGIARFPPPVQAAVVAAYERLGPLAPNAVTVESVTQVGPHHGHGSETTAELRVAGVGRVLIEVLALRRPPAQLTCRATRETPATEYHIESLEVLLPKTVDKWQA
jgi:(2Fe-2S) ferredoxin